MTGACPPPPAVSTCCNVTTKQSGLRNFTGIFFAKLAALWFNCVSFLKQEVGPGSETLKPEPYV
jgi:hypothetical protein